MIEFDNREDFDEQSNEIAVTNNKHKVCKKVCLVFGYFLLIFIGLFSVIFGAFWQKFIIGAPPLDATFVEMPTKESIPEPEKVNPYLMENLTYLPVYPADVKIQTSTFSSFNYTLSDQFLIDGDPQL